jgi:cobaltochelatase CobS
VLLANGGETIPPHPSFRLVCTANSLGHGDESGLYAGTKVLNAAFLDRFASVFAMSYMPAGLEVEVIRSRVPGCRRKDAEQMVKAAADVRRAREEEQIYCTMSTRRLIELARKHGQLGTFTPALELAVLNRLQQSDRQVVHEICQRHLGYVMTGEEGGEHEGD